MRWLPALCLLLGIPTTASAQDDGVFSLDTVLVAPFRPDSAELRVEAERVADLIATQLGNSHIVVPMSEVPQFDEGYDAYTYMNACPPGQHSGCAFVIGQRAGSEWVITGEVRDELEGITASVSFIDVGETNVVLNFGVTLTGDNDQAFAEGVSGVFQKILDGQAEQTDVRGSIEDPAAQAELDRAQAEMLAASITELEDSLGVVERAESGRLDAPRLTKADLQEMSESDDQAPWERIGMTPATYKRFKNSGKNIEEWRDLERGRFGQALIRASFGGGGGPFEHRFDAAYVRSDVDLSVVEVNQIQEVLNGGTTQLFELELGFGVHPWIEVGGIFGLRSSKFRYLIAQSVLNQESVAPEEEFGLITTNYFGGRVNMVALPTYPARPTFGAAVIVWRGTTIDKLVQPPDEVQILKAPTLLIFQLSPGAEVSAGKNINVFARAPIDMPLGGKVRDSFKDGITSLENPPASQGSPRVGIGIQAGVQVRVGLIKSKSSRRPTNPLFEDDLE